ncbi:hypothetical protein FEM48_Zijuj02G0088200 [Ziziphus jujuba var. spinosa]|uniref:Uncharacterized protein n=1 Tax=Ziziphus jujuba var. spinosa TaxID=714518 RepID=A0A978VUS7_ZIZJJ|nr:hypothetical protein FEM48_Zijuj02G0088200 [Ziziphus jujuba var. spinosa]
MVVVSNLMLIENQIMDIDLMLVFIISFKQMRINFSIMFLVFKDQILRVKSLMLFSNFFIEEEVVVEIMVEEVVEIQSQLVKSIILMVIPLPVVTKDLTISLWEPTQEILVSTLTFSTILSSIFLLNLIGNSKLSLNRLKFYSQPTNSHIQRKLVYTNAAYQNSGGLNTVSSVVTISEEFAGACQVANPMTLADSSWYLDSASTNHIVADDGS